MAFDVKRSLTDPVRHISMFDPALDAEHTSFSPERYMATGNEEHMPLRDGQTPSRFVIRPLSSRQYRRAHAAISKEDRVYTLVAFALVAVEGVTVNGEAVSIKRVTIDGLEMADTASLEKIYDPDLFMELAARVEGMSRLDPTRLLGSASTRS